MSARPMIDNAQAASCSAGRGVEIHCPSSVRLEAQCIRPAKPLLITNRAITLLAKF